jgi:hypothetical protein
VGIAKLILALILLAGGSATLLLAPVHVLDVVSENDPDLTAGMIKYLMVIVPTALALVILSTWSIRGFFISRKLKHTRDLYVRRTERTGR